MSVRARRVIEIRTAGVSFNLWHDREVVDWLNQNTLFFYSLNEGGGLTDISVEDLRTMLSEIGSEIDEDVKKAIEADIKFAEEQGEDFVQYYCY